MFASDTELANGALDHLAVSASINDIDDPGDSKAKLLKRQIPLARARLLSRGPWYFARTRVELAEQTNDRNPPWRYKHALPAANRFLIAVYDAATGAEIWREDGAVEALTYPRDRALEITGTAVYSQMERTAALFVTDQPDISLWPAYAQEALAWALAARAAMPITKDSRVKADMEAMAAREVATALALDLNQQPAQDISMAPHTAARVM